MAQQQAPEVGTVMDGYRFKGGDPKQESSWEQVAPVDVSSEYGAGARRLPNGVIERVGPRGGVSRIAAADGGSESSPMVGADARARFMINLGPLQSAQANLERMDEAGYDPSSLRNTGAAALEAIPFDGGFAARAAGGDDYNAYNQAAKTFEAAIMPIMSGAAVTPSEAQRLIRAALPQPGDSPDVLAQKSAQRRQMINAVAQGIGQDAPYADPSTQTDEYGLPEYGIEGGVEIAPGAGGPPAPDSPAGPGAGPESPVDISGLSATDLMALQPGQYIRFPDGRVERLSGAPRLGAEGEQVSPGVYQERRETESADSAQARYREDVTGADRQAAGFMRGVVDTATFGFSDELGAAIDTVLPSMGGQRSGWEDGFGPAYRQNVQNYRAFADADAEDVGGARLAGQVTGGFVPGAGAVRAAQGGTRLARAGRAAGAGAAIGGAYGFGAGEGNALERAPGAAGGAAFGAAVGPLAAPAANALNRGVVQPLVRGAQAGARAIARPVVNALGEAAPTALREAVAPNPLRAGMNRFADRSPQNVNALNAEASRFQAEEIAPAFADVVNDGGRGTLRALATRQTPARQAAREFADGRAAGLQDRVSFQARRTISDDPRQPREMQDEFVSRAREQAAPLYEAAYARPGAPRSPVTDDLMERPSMREAMGRAVRIAREEGRDPNTLGFQFDADGNVQHVREPSMQTMDYLKRGLDDHLESFRDSVTGRLNLDTAGRAAQQTRVAFRRELERLNPTYGEALSAYGDEARLGDAVGIGERFLSMEADDFATSIARLSPEQRQVAQAAARRAVERQAGTQGQAPGVAQRLSNGREQAARTEALTGDAVPVQRAMGAELQALRNAQGVSPAQGSPTSMNAQDAMGAAGAARDMFTGNIAGLAGRAMNAIRSRGFNDAEAEAIVTAAIDPQQTERLIGMLAERMTRREARSLARAIRYQITIAPQSSPQN